MDAGKAHEHFFGPAPFDLETNTFGSGAFGRWTADAKGEPAYDYEPPSEDSNHWHVLGNDHVTATAHGDGYIQLYDWSRGPKLINRWEPRRGQFAGGFKFVEAEGLSFATLRAELPEDAHLSMRFGIGYVEKATTWRTLRLTERVEAPPGETPGLISHTAVENTGATHLEIALTEFWTANLHQLVVVPAYARALAPFFETLRRRFNRRFRVDTAWDPDAKVLSAAFQNRKRAPKPDKPTFADHHPANVFLARLHTGGTTPEAYATDGRCLHANPLHLKLDSAPRLVNGEAAHRVPVILAMRYHASLGPGESMHLEHLFGYADAAKIPTLLSKSRELTKGKRHSIDFVGGPSWLQRETHWHAYGLQANCQYSEFFASHFVDQGSAYAFLQGASGAPRDLALFALPLTYLRPDLAKETLRFLCRSQSAKNGGLPYAFFGHGKTGGAGLHSWSSDIELFFCWAFSEYLAATQDMDFLDEVLPYYPPAKGAERTVREHLHRAFNHVRRHVGVGKHGALKCGTGDWNDPLMSYAALPPLFILRGESTFNAGLAAVAFRALGDVLEEHDDTFSHELHTFAESQAQALSKFWAGDWAARAYVGYAMPFLGTDNLFLDTQAWGVLAGVWDKAQRTRLFDAIRERCTAPEPSGARSMGPPMRRSFMERGTDTNGGTWAILDGLLAWAWAEHDPKSAWDFFLHSSLAHRAEAYPNLWYGIWTGPDAYNASDNKRPGEAFCHVLTPMTAYPAMNANRHAAPLLALVKFCGIVPAGRTIRIAPKLPFPSFCLRTPLIGISYTPCECRGYYEPVVSQSFAFEVAIPEKSRPHDVRLTVNGAPHPFEPRNGEAIAFAAAGRQGERLTWEITQQD